VLRKLKRRRFTLTKEGRIVRGVLLAVGHIFIIRGWLWCLWHIPWGATVGNTVNCLLVTAGIVSILSVLILGGFMIHRFYVRAFRYFTKAPSDCKRLYWHELDHKWMCRSYSSGRLTCSDYQQCSCYLKSKKLNYKY